jgi:hypothetical protein
MRICIQVLKDLIVYICKPTCDNVRFVAFPATEYDEVLSGYQPGEMVER